MIKLIPRGDRAELSRNGAQKSSGEANLRAGNVRAFTMMEFLPTNSAAPTAPPRRVLRLPDSGHYKLVGGR